MPVAVPPRHQPKRRIGTVAGGAGSWQMEMKTADAYGRIALCGIGRHFKAS